jgi:hypothetical protein
MTTTAQPWERQPDESSPAFDAFVAYRDDPDRSLRGVAARLHKSLTIVGRWSSKHRWVERCEAWDAYLDATRRDATAETVADVARRHVAAARMMQEKALLRLAGMHPSELTPTELLRFLLAAIHLEREAGVVLLCPEDAQADQDTVVALLSNPETRRLATQLHEAAQALTTPAAPAGDGRFADAVGRSGTPARRPGMAAPSGAAPALPAAGPVAAPAAVPARRRTSRTPKRASASQQRPSP